MTQREQLTAAHRLCSFAATPNRGHVIMDEIRTEVWDYLYKNGPASLETIARGSGGTVQTIQAATDEESSQILRNLFSSEDRTSER